MEELGVVPILPQDHLSVGWEGDVCRERAEATDLVSTYTEEDHTSGISEEWPSFHASQHGIRRKSHDGPPLDPTGLCLWIAFSTGKGGIVS